MSLTHEELGKRLICHFRKMEYCAGDNGEGGQYEEWFECNYCGCVKDMEGHVIDIETGERKIRR